MSHEIKVLLTSNNHDNLARNRLTILAEIDITKKQEPGHINARKTQSTALQKKQRNCQLGGRHM